MKRIIFLLIATAALSACASSGKPIEISITDSPCGTSTKGYTPASVSYHTKNTFEMSMKLKWDVGESTEFRIRLKPKRGSEGVLVKTIGKSGNLPPNGTGGPTPFGWLDGSGTAFGLTDQILILCVPPGIPKGTIYKFDVDIDGIGRLDPRVEVTN